MRIAPFFLLLLTACAQPKGEIRLIVQGDDMGAGHGVNVATLDAHRRGILRSTNVLTPGAWMPEAARLLAEVPDLDVGVHLTLTAEWTDVKWRPLTLAPSLSDPNGFFYPRVWKDAALPPHMSVQEANPNLGEVERELRTQIELARRMIPRVNYLWPHMGFNGLSPELGAIVSKLSREYNMPLPGPAIGVQYLRSPYTSRDSGSVRAEKLAAQLSKLGPGTWLIVDHAATDTPEIRAFGHPGYEFVAADRSAVVEAWTSPQVMAAVRERGIVLCGYRDLLRKSK